jgi:predicted O-methyltransferase YrrM
MSDLGFCPKKHKGLSSDMFSKFDDNYFSMIFIDGSHDYKSVVDDMKLYYPKLKSGGIFAGHDYTQRDIGVIKAVNEFSEKYSIPFEVKNTSWYMIKK